MNKYRALLANFLPGIFLVGLNIGTGTITVMAKAGAEYGMELAWTIGLSCFITFFLINIYGKFTLVTGETALSAFRKHIHPVIGLFFIVALTANVSGSIMGVMGIIADVCSEWSGTYIHDGISPVYFALFFIGLVYCIFLLGKTSAFEKIMAIIVGVMSLCFLINFIMLIPSSGFNFNNLNTGIAQSNGSALPEDQVLITASMVGTTVFSGLFIVRSILVKEIGWKLKDYKIQKWDAIVSTSLMFIIAISIMGSAASVLHNRGVALTDPSQMLNLLEPVAGRAAAVIFGIGIIAAGISSQFPNVILLPMLISDYKGESLKMNSNTNRIIVLLLSLLGLVVPIFNAKPIAVMVASQAFGALLLPFTIGCILYLGNKKSLLQINIFSRATNIILSLIMLFAIYMSYNSIAGMISLLKST